MLKTVKLFDEQKVQKNRIYLTTEILKFCNFINIFTATFDNFYVLYPY